MKSKKKIVLAYSGGLDTSIILKWLQENYDADVICYTADVGQEIDRKKIITNAKKFGVKNIIIKDLKDIFVKDYVYPMIRGHAIYEGVYLLGTSIARPLIAKDQIREAKKFNIKVARVTPGGPMGAEYEVTFSGAEKDLIAYAKEHLGFDDKPGNFMQLKKHLNMSYNDIEEISDKLKLKVLKKKINQYKDKVFKKTMSTVKSPLFAGVEEALEIKEFTSQMIDRLKKSFSTAPKRISPEQANKLSKHLDRIELNDLRKLVKANIPFVSTVARNKIYKKTGKFEETNLEEKRLYVEAIAGLQKKADKSGMPYSILKKVYDRGMAAWKSGHRPGASQQQWAFARVNSFITKSSGTWGGADKDLAAKVKGSK